MKRYIIAIIGLLLCYGLNAQTRTCRYWFDGNIGQSVTTIFSGNVWDAEIDVSQLPDGIHSLHYYLTDTTSTPVRGYLFHKISTVPTSELKYYYWFDEDISTEQTGALGDGNILLDVTGLDNGEHTLYMYLEGSNVTAPQTFVFSNNLAVDENEYGSLVVYPNPVKNRLMIESDEVIHQCEVYSITGQLLLSVTNCSDRLEVPVEELPQGVYLVKLVADKFVRTKTFVKK